MWSFLSLTAFRLWVVTLIWTPSCYDEEQECEWQKCAAVYSPTRRGVSEREGSWKHQMHLLSALMCSDVWSLSDFVSIVFVFFTWIQSFGLHCALVSHRNLVRWKSEDPWSAAAPLVPFALQTESATLNKCKRVVQLNLERFPVRWSVSCPLCHWRFVFHFQ